MWLKKLKKKKLQCFLIGMLLFLSSLIFTSGLSVLTSINDYVRQYYANDRFYDIILFNANENSKDDILQWCEKNRKINDVIAIDGAASGNDLYYNGKNLKISLYTIVSLEDDKNLPFELNKVSSLDNESYPKEGEVWITKIFADNFNISLGDNLIVKTKEKDISLKVTSFVNDSNQPSSIGNLVIVYTNKESFKEFSSFVKAPMIYIDVKNNEDVSELETDLTSSIKVGGYAFDKELLILSSTMVSSIVGGISTLASLLVFIVSVLLIRFILWNNILKDYKSIGIYKALGFSNSEILKFYIIGYSLIALVGSFLGAITSIPVLNYTANKILKYIGDFNGLKSNFIVIFATIIVFSLVVIINLYFVIRRTNKISPVEALRTGVTSSKKKLTKSLIKNTASPIALAINDIFKYKKISAFITLTLSLSLTLVLLFGNFNVSILKMKENTNVWVGFPKSDVTISGPLWTSRESIKEVLDQVKVDNRVKNFVYGSISLGDVTLDTKKYNVKSSIYNVAVMSSYSKELGFTVIEGHNPIETNEVSVTLNILKEAELSIGDYIELSINNKKNSYLISGSYNSIDSNGYGLRILSSAVEKENPNFVGSEIFLNLKEASKIESFEKEINDKFTNLDASNAHPLIRYTLDPIPGTILPMTYLLVIVFIAFSSISILNIIIMNIRDNRRNFGIMKALGFTTKEISRRFLYRILILTVFSVIVAVVLNLTVTRPIIAAAIMNLDVLIISPVTMIALIGAMIVLIIFVILVSSRTIKSTKPNELMEE